MTVSTRIRLLTIDKDPSLLEALKDIVAHHPDMRVTHLDSTSLIYEMLHYDRFDLALCDYTQASEDDFRLIRELRQSCPGIAILLLVDTTKDHFALEALEAGADGFFYKPFTYDKFALILEPGYWKALDRLDWWELNEEPLAPFEEAFV